MALPVRAMSGTGPEGGEAEELHALARETNRHAPQTYSIDGAAAVSGVQLVTRVLFFIAKRLWKIETLLRAGHAAGRGEQ